MSYCAHCGAEAGAQATACPACGKPPRSLPGGAPRKSSRAPMVVLIVACVGVGAVAVLGIVAAIFIPNLLDALHKAKQKRTVADMRQVGAAWLSWVTDEVGAAAAGASTVYDLEALEQVLSAAELERQLRAGPGGQPYIVSVPALDGWGHSLEYRQADNLLAGQVMAIRSPGRDGEYSGSAYERGVFEAWDYDQDIVWADGYFIRAPAGTRLARASSVPPPGGNR